MTSRAWWTAAGALAPLGLIAALDGRIVEVDSAAGPPEPRYDRDIRPILSDRCFKCHGPDAAKRQADLRLDVGESAKAERDGVIAIVPGDVAASEMWRRVNSHDLEERMPPPDSNKRPLDAAERELVRRWIEAGAPYEPHWSFSAPVRSRVPDVEDAHWPRNDVDRFLLARMEAEGVRPSPEADRATLLRRLFLDLTGLPPTPEELEAFLADEGPDAPRAYERWVERLFTEEPYASRHAERMAIPWMDQARYADTCGIHMDAGRTIWPWRDWLLEAYRTNMPFDRFVIEQIAGDLLPDATQAQKVASGFNRNHVTTDEGGAIAEEYLVEYAAERTATTGSVFLGLTLGCARCHEHKFDPISQDEFYGLYAFFNSIDEPGLYSQLPDPLRAFEPFLDVPSAEQLADRARLQGELERARAELDAPDPGEDAELVRFLAETGARAGVAWQDATVLAAVSTGGATLTPQSDGSVLASGANPDVDDHVITLRVQGEGLRLVALEALADASLVNGRVGRAVNGNAVLSGIEVEAVSVADPRRRLPLRLTWAWADFEQENGDFRVLNALDPDALGWAVDAHNREGGRVALFLSEEPFGFPGGTELVVRLQYRSIYAQHVFGRERLSVGRIDEAGLALLPEGLSDWYVVGPFPVEEREAGYEARFGPEDETRLDRTRNFDNGNQYWTHDPGLDDGRANPLTAGMGVLYVARRVLAPSARRLDASIGSDDGFQIYLDAEREAERRVDRPLAPDQDALALDLAPGAHLVVFKVINTGGEAGFYWRDVGRAGELDGDLALALLPSTALDASFAARLRRAWRLSFSPDYRQRAELVVGLEASLTELDQAIPRTMVMSELAEPRATHVLMRGQYDKPDPNRPIARGVPAALGALAPDAPRDRLGLARWLVASENPLVARVAVNRLWELVFGTGLVRTTEDFGMQGEWPSHPELLDWLALEFRESGWDVRNVLRLLVTSSAYRQSSRARPELAERDPENRLLARWPRRRLGAEELRDSALFVGGLLVERFGGPSVKPYQPDGLWQEVAMVQSNTRIYERGAGEDLWRRSLYTYWKRACPPPALMTFDAPTREFCTIRRPTTNTPLQALVLWNDEQFVEAARALAARTLDEAVEERVRLERMFRRCTGRAPDEEEHARLAEALAGWRARFAAEPADARALIEVGESPVPMDADPVELAAWSLLANALLNLDATITRS
jgi:hypothetical protein